ncbi:hypothetical protein D9619_008153 [Psilocybe cf. subviscida]|uniref:ATP-dependent RNA helicase n=1 Tax=Psilocybe cf. subviscida TaxID=2480587 RepID=A0A8H5AV66_9AGAR|nr:hypothetical protein D9619_008153 [Psilocybe cf. subviscida]
MATPPDVRPSRSFGTPEDNAPPPSSAARRVLGKISFSSLRPPFLRSRSLEDGPPTPNIERAPIPTMASGELDMTPLPKLSMIVLSITMLGEFLSANVSTPFLLFMVRGLGDFKDEADVAFWTGILVSTFFLTQFVTSLLWATIAEKHGRRAVLMISLFGSAVTCFMFGTAKTLPQAICIRLLQGIFAGAVGVARGCVAFITDPSNEGRAYAILGFCWGMGGVAGAIIGGSFERPAVKWPDVFGDVQLFVDYPYLLPCTLAAAVTLIGSILSLFLGHDGGPREGAIRLPPEKNVTHPPSPEETLSTHSAVFEDDDELPRGIVGIPARISRRVSDYFGGRLMDTSQGVTSSGQPPLPMTATPDTQHPRTFSRTSKTNGSAYGYGGYRSRLASGATLNGRRGSTATSMRYRRGSNVDNHGRGSMAESTSDLNFAQRLLLANENAVTNIADLWVAAAMNVDNEDVFESDSDIEEDNDPTIHLHSGESLVNLGDSTPQSNTNASASSPNATTPDRNIRSGSQASPLARLSRTHRPSTTNSLFPSSSLRHASSSPNPNRANSVSFSPMVPPSPRRPSTNAPSIFAHSGVKMPSAVLDAQQLLLSTGGMDSSGSHLGHVDPLATISESRPATESDLHSRADVESLAEKLPSLTSQLPIVVIIQYGVMALHTTSHDQIFMSYLVSDYESGGLNLNAGHFAQLIALMCLFQIAYQFYLYPNIGPPRGRFSHLAMFRIGTVMFIPAYLTVILYRPFANKNSPDDSNPFLMFVLAVSTAVRYCGTTFGYTAISILLNYMTPPAAVGYANGIAQSIVSLARCVGPVIGGYDALSSRKRTKIQHRNADELPWKSVSRPSQTGLAGDDGVLELEEVEGVEVLYEETDGGRVVKFNVVAEDLTEREEPVVDEHGEQTEEDVEPADEPADEEDEPMIVDEPTVFDTATILPNWSKFPLHPKVMKALHTKGFTAPTAIQSASLPFALASRDVVGIAQTGSGKTLAYGLPILHYLLSQPRPSAKTKRPVRALILAPTRELALQVSTHLNSILTSIEFAKGDAAEQTPSAASSSKAPPVVKKPPPHVSIAAIVGGMSSQKQRRIIDRGVDVLVATPGRLWDIMENDDELATEIRHLRFLVLDEADRMIEAGHFAELENILRLTLLETKDEAIPDVEDPSFQMDVQSEDDTKEGIKDQLQTFVFSATLSKDLQRNVKKKFRPKGNKKHYKREQKPATTLDDLLLRLDFRDPEPEVIDLSPKGGVVSTLQEGKIECLSGDKDVYLYYFLLRYPGKSLVFLSSIDGIRRLMPLVELLGVNAYPLHSQLEQRQRLKNLDRFTNTPNSVLLATDIAARGLDIPAVDHVIHFQIPRSADTYIHRNGRTARAMRKGFSMLMVAPDERRVVRALLGNLNRDEAEIPEITVELSMLDKLKTRIQLARKIENAQHKIKKTNHDRNWMRETAETLGVELDSDYMSESDNESKLSTQKRKAKDHKMQAMKAELKHLLSQPLIAKGVSARYITSGSRSIVDDLLAGDLNDSMLGMKKAEAGSEMTITKKRKPQPKSTAVKQEEFDSEWKGISTKA